MSFLGGRWYPTFYLTLNGEDKDEVVRRLYGLLQIRGQDLTWRTFSVVFLGFAEEVVHLLVTTSVVSRFLFLKLVRHWCWLLAFKSLRISRKEKFRKKYREKPKRKNDTLCLKMKRLNFGCKFSWREIRYINHRDRNYLFWLLFISDQVLRKNLQSGRRFFLSPLALWFW